MLFELGENLTQDEGTVEAVIGRWWGPYLLEHDGHDRQMKITEEAGRAVYGISEGLRDGRGVDLHGVVKGLCAIVRTLAHALFYSLTNDQDSISFVNLIRCFDTPNTIAAYHTSLPLILSLLVIPPQTPVPPLAGLLPDTLDTPLWTDMASLLSVLDRLTSLPPDALPIFTSPNAPPPSVYARIVEPPAADSTMSKMAKQQAKDIQGAGLWNTLGLVRVLVAACAIADTDHASEESAEVGRRATEMLDKAAALAPELVLIALERISVRIVRRGGWQLILNQESLPTPVSNMHNRLMGMYLAAPPGNITSSQLVFHQLYQMKPGHLLQILLEFYQEDENHLGRIVDVALEVKVG